MRVEKRVLGTIEKVYSLTFLPGRDRTGFVAGSEADGELVLFSSPAFEPKVIARRPGGFMSLWPLERGSRRYVLASADFKPVFKAENCRILLYPLDTDAEPREVLALPYAHRIAVTDVDGELCFLASTLCAHKDFTDDWSHPGGIHLGRIPGDPAAPWRVTQILGGLTRNHGMEYAHLEAGTRGGFLLSAAEGLFFLRIPQATAGAWQCERIAAGEHSDACAAHLGGTGVADIFTLSPFHGNVLRRYHRTNGVWEGTDLDDTLAMGHIVWAGTFLGEPCCIAGSREGRRELRLYRFAGSTGARFTMEILDEGIGATQMLVSTLGPNHTRLIAAGHAEDRVLLYDVLG